MLKRLFLSLLLIYSCSSEEEEPAPPPPPVKYTLTTAVNPAEGGTITPASGEYNAGTTVTITASPAAEYVFKDWTGATGTNASISVVMSSDKSVTANFVKKQYPLTVEIEGEGTVSEKVIKQGLATDYNSGTIVELTAEPTGEWEFVEWKGDLTSTDNPAQITIDKAKTVTAVFVKKQYPLTVEIEGEGSVTEKVIKAGVATDYNSGTIVELTATAETGWEFKEWSGDLTGTDNPSQITIDAAKTVKAVFVKKQFTVNITIEGEGTVTSEVMTGLKVDNKYEYGTDLKLTANAETGWEFKEWSGDLTGTDNPSQITIDAAKTVKAVFVKKQFTVNITIEGEGTVTSEVMTGLKVDNKYEYGTDLKLTANAETGWEFKEWSGDIISTENPVQITIDGSKNVKVKFFNENYFELTYGGEQGEPFEDYNNVVDGPDQNGFLVQSFSEGKSSSVNCDLCVENELHNIVAYSTDELKNQFANIDWKDVSVLDGNKLISFYADGRNNDDSNYPGVGGGPSDGSYSKRVELADNRTEGKFTNGDERYYTLSFWAPSDIWDNSTKWSVVMSQFKQFGGGQPNFEVRLSQEGDYVLTVRAKYNDIPYTDITTVKPDQWNHLKYYIKHSNDSDGKIIIWFNGEKVFEHDGRTLYYNGKDGYFKFGMYTEMRDERILLFDRIKISNGLNGKTIDEWSKDQN